MTEPINQQTDGALLAAFATTGNQGAFAAIVQRHAPMVHGVCLRVLGDHHEAEDAVQAVFLTLARKAAALHKDPSIGGWLHTVARRLAKDVRRSRVARQQREETAMRDPSLAGNESVDPGLFREALDDAIGDLPERYRRPLVLFHLEGQSLQQTAAQLGLNPSTTGNRLARSRELLRKKLVRRGVTVGSVGALTVLLSAESGAAVLPATLVASTVGAATGGAVSTTVAALTKGALNMLFIAKVKTVSLAAAACLIVAGTGVVTAKQFTTPSTIPITPQVSSPVPKPTAPPPVTLPEPVSTMTVAQPITPREQPAPAETFLAIPNGAAARAAMLKQDAGSFRLDICYFGVQPQAEPERYFWNLNLSVKMIERAKMPGSGTWDKQISQEQAIRIIDYLAQDGTLEQGKAYTGWEEWKELTKTVPQYGLIVYYPNPTPNRKHGLDGTTTTMIDLDATTVKRLEGLRTVLPEKITPLLDQILKALAPSKE